MYHFDLCCFAQLSDVTGFSSSIMWFNSKMESYVRVILVSGDELTPGILCIELLSSHSSFRLWICSKTSGLKNKTNNATCMLSSGNKKMTRCYIHNVEKLIFKKKLRKAHIQNDSYQSSPQSYWYAIKSYLFFTDFSPIDKESKWQFLKKAAWWQWLIKSLVKRHCANPIHQSTEKSIRRTASDDAQAGSLVAGVNQMANGTGTEPGRDWARAGPEVSCGNGRLCSAPAHRYWESRAGRYTYKHTLSIACP